jgi:very-short-patch-repair endonuclease
LAIRASTRYGLFTTAEALEMGATKDVIRHRVASGRWVRLQRGVFCIGGTPASWRRSLLAAVLAAGPGSGASHLAAGALWRLPDCPEDAIEVSVLRRRRIRQADFLIHRPRELTTADLTVVDAIPVTTPPRTLIDLAGIVSAEVLEEALDDALRRRLVTIAWLRWRIDELKRPGKPGIGVIEALCAAREDDGKLSESILEDKLYRVLTKARLPEPVRQYEVRIGGRVYRLDFAYPDQLIAIEADGYASRASRSRWQQELTRQNALVEAGWLPLRFTWTDVEERPEIIVTKIANALASRRLG